MHINHNTYSYWLPHLNIVFLSIPSGICYLTINATFPRVHQIRSYMQKNIGLILHEFMEYKKEKIKEKKNKAQAREMMRAKITLANTDRDIQ